MRENTIYAENDKSLIITNKLMKKLNILLKPLSVALVFSGIAATAQTPEQTQKITSGYNKSELLQMAEQFRTQAKTEKTKAEQYAKERNLPIIETTENGSLMEVQRLLADGTLLYYQTQNIDAAKSTRTNHVNPGGSLGLDLAGENMTAYVWDGGHPRITHREYQSPNGEQRVSIGDATNPSLHFHAAHVVGTITATGVNNRAQGMAPLSYVIANDWNQDRSEATAAVLDGMLVSNHSYGYRVDTVPDWMFGAYISDSFQWDALMYNAPFYLPVVSAGNDGRSTNYNGSPLANGFDMLSGMATSKNNLVIANANDANVDNDGNLISVTIDGTSSPGPTDDLRIKPDITGNGVGLFSTLETSDSAYGSLSGTSMSAPNVSGSLLLLQEHHKNLYGHFMRAATLKGLALHTADDAGPIGPDSRWGWGLLNMKRAAETLNNNGNTTLVEEMVLTENSTITFEVTADGVNDLSASISWTDLPGTAVHNTLNSPDPVLVNDLDIRVTKGSNTHYPWRLTSPTANSKDGDNNVDPFERIDVANASGTYTVTITHKGTLETGSQPFTLIITGIEVECDSFDTPENLTVSQITEDSALISWDPIIGANYDLRYKHQNDADWTTVSDITGASYLLTDLVSSKQYEVEVRSKCSASQTSGYSDSILFDIGCVFDVTTEVEPITRVVFADIDNPSSASSTEVLEDFTDIESEVSRRATYEIALEGNTNGANTSYFTVWIDWNQNGSFDDPGEIFEIGSITNSTGNDGQQATASIEIPSTARLGETTMRVVKSSGSSPVEACYAYEKGQAEEYTLVVNRTVGIDDQQINDFVYYPNPTNDVVFLDSKLSVEKLSVFNILGQEVISKPKFNGNQVDMSHLSNGTYLFKVVFENGSVETFKILKN